MNDINKVFHIGNAGSRCQWPVYSVQSSGVFYTVIPEIREVTYVLEVGPPGLLRRKTIAVTDEKFISELVSDVDRMLAQ